MNLAELRQVGRAPALPLAIELADAAGSAELTLQRLLRVLPGQRYVAQAEWRGRPVLAKLLVGDKAARHFQRERDGARQLAEQGLKTPALLADGLREGEGGWLLFEYLDDAESLWNAWRAVEDQPLLSGDQQAVLADALVSIAQMHAKGLWQADLHLDNLLRHSGQLFVIDGGGVQVETAGQPLSRGKVLENLGMFFAQLPAEVQPFIEELLVHYLLANGEHALPLEALLAEVVKVRRWRLRDYMKKIARDCSLFHAKVGAFGLRVVRRECVDEFATLLAQPDVPLAQGRALKQGGSATVTQVRQSDRDLVVKRYNIKSFIHCLKRFWRPSRAWHSWVEGNRLQLLGIDTPQPLAVLERRWCWLRGRAYLITEYCRGQDIIARFQAYQDGPPPPEAELLALDRLFAALLRERISHGDFKGSNVFWDENVGRWLLIDLDAMQQHRSARSFARAYARDRARFLRNWPADSALHQLLNQRIPLTPAVGSAD
ncbi:lipopolysaccharide kinase InaA family protein [Pseudomonas sp. 1928-m]|uniref:lipopolysaccharide kinase InaA family protein n=1 Tax=Pseudomonas sp. 1928-m TaxID=3033804 RepID=UPI0023E0269C|nr:lipopolysaccharide kinase InaA family protein [Pseudomonas sp. 1928-m]MDF3193737.1 lipopolysaccharide kinase InaA family protein [Pseudomonas sp. 1928-m]